MVTIPRVPSADNLRHHALALTLGHAPWSAQYPYQPEVSLRIAHDGSTIFLEWHISEDCIRAKALADGGAVWEDSCVEFFLQLPNSTRGLTPPPEICRPFGANPTPLPPQPLNSPTLQLPNSPTPQLPNSPTPQLPNSSTPYYNIECNCAGRLLVGYGPDRRHRELLPAGVMSAIVRQPSLGSEPRPLTDGHCEWTLRLSVPLTTFIYDDLPTLSGVQARANFYKCGDGLTRPHFLTAFPIHLPKPDFHCPQFFQPIMFE